MAKTITIGALTAGTVKHLLDEDTKYITIDTVSGHELVKLISVSDTEFEVDCNDIVLEAPKLPTYNPYYREPQSWSREHKHQTKWKRKK